MTNDFATLFNIKSEEIHANGKEKGWWDQERNPLELIALVHSELSEAVESLRKGEDHYFAMADERGLLKPEGAAVECADAIIRIMDMAGHYGWDLGGIIEQKVAYNKTRTNRHGGKKY
jgi:NTP pyrophosphatase (non-canonical NTP hydrolase)